MSGLTRSQVQAFDEGARAAIGAAPDEASRHFAVRAMEFANEARRALYWLEQCQAEQRGAVEQIDAVIAFLRLYPAFEAMWEAAGPQRHREIRTGLADAMWGDGEITKSTKIALASI